MADAKAEHIRSEASIFAQDLTARLHRVVRTTGELEAILLPGVGHRVLVGLVADDQASRFARFPLHIDGEHLLDLFIKFFCCLDTSDRYLAVEESWMKVLPAVDEYPVPLFRYEYLREARGHVPASHLQVHAHRDEFVRVMVAAERGKPRQRRQAGRVPRLAEFHFPLGGHRFRPCLEDVLHALVTEFSVDAATGWETAVREGREAWRRTQLKTAVRDAPQDAVDVLRDLGFEMARKGGEMPPDNLARLRAY